MKLWNVKITIEALVMAETEREADGFAREIVNNEGYIESCVDSTEYGLMPFDYADDSLVYHKGTRDITVKEAKEIAGVKE